MPSPPPPDPAALPPPACTPPAAFRTVLSSDSLALPADTPQSWLCQGYLARACLTLLTSQWKSGKITLLSILLTRRDL